MEKRNVETSYCRGYGPVTRVSSCNPGLRRGARRRGRGDGCRWDWRGGGEGRRVGWAAWRVAAVAVGWRASAVAAVAMGCTASVVAVLKQAPAMAKLAQ